MTWHQPWPLRLLMGVVALGILANSVYLLTFTRSAADIFLAVAVALAGCYVAILAWRCALIIDAATLTIRGVFRTTTISRDEITGVDAGNDGVFIRYTRNGRTHTASAEAGQGYLNSLGGKVTRRTTRSQKIAARLADWQQTGAVR